MGNNLINIVCIQFISWITIIDYWSNYLSSDWSTNFSRQKWSLRCKLLHLVIASLDMGVILFSQPKKFQYFNKRGIIPPWMFVWNLFIFKSTLQFSKCKKNWPLKGLIKVEVYTEIISAPTSTKATPVRTSTCHYVVSF